MPRNNAFYCVMVHMLQVLFASDSCTKAVWRGEGAGYCCPHIVMLSGHEQQYQDGSWNRGLSSHRIWVQQIQVRNCTTSLLLYATSDENACGELCMNVCVRKVGLYCVLVLE